MRDYHLQTIDHPHRNDAVEIFGRPVILARRGGLQDQGTAVFIAADGAACLDQRAPISGSSAVATRRSIRMVSAARRSGAPHLGIDADANGLVRVGIGIDEQVADAFEMGEQAPAPRSARVPQANVPRAG